MERKRAALLRLAITMLMAGATVAHGQTQLITFDPNPNLPVIAVVVQPDGMILIGGSFTTLSPNGGAAVTRKHIARLKPDGTLDAAFNPNADLDVNAIALQPDGKIVIGGFFTSINGETHKRIARLNADGTPETAFDPNASSRVRALALQADGKILVGGDFNGASSIGGQTRNRIARLNSDGSIDMAFNPDATDVVHVIAVQPDGKILVGGRFNGTNSIGGATRNRMARLKTDGTADPGFDPNASSAVFALAVQLDAKILAAGDFTGIGGATRNHIARLNANGTADMGFDPNADLDTSAFALLPDGKILTGGDFSTIGTQSRSRLARLDPVTGAADGFDPSASANASVYAIALQTNGNIVVGGNFTSLGGQPRHHIARLGPDGSIPYTVNTTSDSVVANACAMGLPSCSLRGAIEAGNASAGPNAVIFAIPTNELNCDPSTGQCIVNLTGALPDISESMSFAGPGVNLLTVRHSPAFGDGFRIFNVTAGGIVSFSGLTISRGATSGGSASGGNGGGINNAGSGTVNVDHCTISENSAGAVAQNDQNGHGGGIANASGKVNISNSALTDNGSFPIGGGGAAIFNSGGVVTLTNSTLAGNQSLTNNFGGGGGIFNASGVVDITNSTLTGNSVIGGANAVALGGAIYSADVVNITNSTITGNSVSASGDAEGGGVFNSNGTANVKSTLIAINTADSGGPDVAGAFTSAGFNLIGKIDDKSTGFTAVTDQRGTITSPLDPQLDPNGLQDNGGPTKTIALLLASPAIDKASSNGLTGVVATDQRGAGFPRTSDNTGIANASRGDGTDIGAFEVQTSSPTPTPTATPAATSTPTSTPKSTPTVTPKTTATPSATPKATATPTATPTGTPKATATPTATPKATATPSATPKATATPRATPTATPRASATPKATATPTATPKATPGLVANVSTRLPVATGDDALIEGFIIQGPSGSIKKILVRAIGPSLKPFGIPDALANPTLGIFNSNNTQIASNDNWKTTHVGGIITSSQVAEINGSKLAPSNDLESAIVANLTPGSYTGVVRGANNSVGTGVVDAFDLSPASTARVANISTRGLIQPGDKLMIAGFIVQKGSVRVVISALGPSLTAFGIPNALPDTTLQLRDQNGVIVRQNDDWMTTQKVELENTGLQPNNPQEAALVATIPPGQYTAQVRGKPETTGIGVVQVFFLQ